MISARASTPIRGSSIDATHGTGRVNAASARPCGPTRNLAYTVLRKQAGFWPRTVDTLALGELNGFDDGHSLLEVKKSGQRIYGIGAPSRSSTLINYVGLNDGILDCVLEIAGSYKIGKYVPGTVVPVVDEKLLFENPPDFALLFSWHIAD